MFKGSETAGKTLLVQISTVNGESLRGCIEAGVTGKLIEFMNREASFFEFLGTDGQTIILSKSSVRSMALIEQPRIDQLSRRARQDKLDPYSILEIPRGASAEEVRSAYRQRVRLYHPDNLAGSQVPAEVLEYVTAMFRRLTEAYQELCKPTDIGKAA